VCIGIDLKTHTDLNLVLKHPIEHGIGTKWDMDWNTFYPELPVAPKDSITEIMIVQNMI